MSKILLIALVKKIKKTLENPLTFQSNTAILKTMKALLKKIKLAIADSKLGQFSNPVYRLKYRPYTDNGNKEVYDYLVSRPFDGWVDGFILGVISQTK